MHPPTDNYRRIRCTVHVQTQNKRRKGVIRVGAALGGEGYSTRRPSTRSFLLTASTASHLRSTRYLLGFRSAPRLMGTPTPKKIPLWA